MLLGAPTQGSDTQYAILSITLDLIRYDSERGSSYTGDTDSTLHIVLILNCWESYKKVDVLCIVTFQNGSLVCCI